MTTIANKRRIFLQQSEKEGKSKKLYVSGIFEILRKRSLREAYYILLGYFEVS